MIYLDCFLTLLLALVSLASLSRHSAWWVRVWDFPRVQLLVISGVLVLTQWYVWADAPLLCGILLIIALLCFAYHGWWVLPYTVWGKKQVKDASGYLRQPGIRLLVANVLTPNRGADKLLKLVSTERPDILVAVETDLWWQQQLSVLDSDYPYRLQCPKDNLYGMHVWSKFPLSDAQIQYLVDDEIPSMHMLVKLNDEVSVRLHCLHPMPPSPTENDESTDRDAELVMVGKSVADSHIPTIVTGDLNDVAWSATTRLFLKLSGLLDPRRGRGMFCTFHAGYPIFRWPLDHVFHSQDFLLGTLRRLESIGSDHYPFLAHLFYSPEKGAMQQSLEKAPEDEQLAREILAQTDSEASAVHTPGERF